MSVRGATVPYMTWVQNEPMGPIPGPPCIPPPIVPIWMTPRVRIELES